MIKRIMVVAIITVLAFSGIALGNVNKFVKLERGQVNAIDIAYRHGGEIHFRGDTWGETAASIVYQESHANRKKFQTNGVIVGDKNSKGRPRSLGPAQVQVDTAFFVMEKYPHVRIEKYGKHKPTREEVTIDLLVDIEFNIHVGVHYFEWLLHRKQNVKKAILAYNRGPGGKGDPNNYVEKVLKWRTKVVRPFLKGNWILKGE